MKLLLDEGVPQRSAALLRDQDLDAVHVYDLGLAGIPDSEILETAVSASAIVVTLDSDFHQLLALTEASKPSVIRIRCEALNHTTAVQWITRVIDAVGEELTQGVAVSVNEESIRVHRLPLGEKE